MPPWDPSPHFSWHATSWTKPGMKNTETVSSAPPLHLDEGDMEKLVYIPSGNGRRELDSVVLNLTKLCIDYIDESVLEQAEKPGGINKLKATLGGGGGLRSPFLPCATCSRFAPPRWRTRRAPNTRS